MTETPKSTNPDTNLSIFSRFVRFIKRERLEFQARLSNCPYLIPPFGGPLSAESMKRIRGFEEEALMELGRKID